MNYIDHQKIESMRNMTKQALIRLMDHVKPDGVYDPMDVSDDDGESLPEKLNSYNKRVRTDVYYENTVPIGTNELSVFNERSKFEKIIPPYFDTPSDYPKNEKYIPQFKTREEYIQYSEWKRENDKNNIRMLLQINRFNKKKALETEKKINTVMCFNPKMFV